MVFWCLFLWICQFSRCIGSKSCKVVRPLQKKICLMVPHVLQIGISKNSCFFSEMSFAEEKYWYMGGCWMQKCDLILCNAIQEEWKMHLKNRQCIKLECIHRQKYSIFLLGKVVCCILLHNLMKLKIIFIALISKSYTTCLKVHEFAL